MRYIIYSFFDITHTRPPHLRCLPDRGWRIALKTGNWLAAGWGSVYKATDWLAHKSAVSNTKPLTVHVPGADSSALVAVLLQQ